MLAKKPYKGYKLYKVYHKKEERYYAVLFKTNNDRTTVAWAKYLAEIKVGRKLGRDWHVHHKDENRINDTPGNLKICSPKVHSKEHKFTHKWLVKARCAFCRDKFCRVFRGIRSKFGERKFYYCSKDCGYKGQRLGSVIKASKAKLFYGEVIKELI